LRNRLLLEISIFSNQCQSQFLNEVKLKNYADAYIETGLGQWQNSAHPYSELNLRER